MLKITAALTLALFASNPVFAGFSMSVPEIRMVFKTSDGAPVAGVGLAYNLTAEVLKATDGSSFITVPSLPHWSRTTIGIEMLGDTDVNGELAAPPEVFASRSPFKRAPECNIFSNGVIFVCETQAVSLPMKEACGTRLTESSDKRIDLDCGTTLTGAEVEQQLSDARAKCL